MTSERICNCGIKESEHKKIRHPFIPIQENTYTEEQVIGFAEWILNSDSKKVLTRTKESLLKEYIESLKQPKKD